MNAVRLAKLLTALQEWRPTTSVDLDAMGISYKEIGHGSYREVFWLKGYNAVIKFPMQDTGYSFRSDEGCLAHSKYEMDAFERIRTSRSPLKKYLPEIYYQDYQHGVIVMKKYQGDWQTAYNTKRSDALSDRAYVLSEKLRKFFRLPRVHSDYGGDNLGLDKQGKFRIIDLGVC